LLIYRMYATAGRTQFIKMHNLYPLDGKIVHYASKAKTTAVVTAVAAISKDFSSAINLYNSVLVIRLAQNLAAIFDFVGIGMFIMQYLI
jgi:hypothetical protein